MSTGTPTPATPTPSPTRGPASSNTTADPQNTGSQSGQSQDVEGGECPAEPLEAFRQALDENNAEEAWSAWNSLSDTDRGSLDDSDIEKAVGLFYPAQGLAAIQSVFGELCIEMPRQLEISRCAGILDEELAFQIVNTPGVTAEEQAAVAADPGVMAELYALAAGCYMPHEFFTILAGDQTAFIQACAVPGPLADWVACDDATLEAVTAALPDYPEWTRTFEAQGAWDRLLKLAAASEEAGLDWWAGVTLGSGYTWIVDGASKPIAEELVPGLWALYGDGALISLEDKYKTWDCLYSARLVHTGEDLETWRSNVFQKDGYDTTRMRIYHGVAPNDEAMNLFFQQFKQIPRTQINLASTIIMCDYRYYKLEQYKAARYFLFIKLSDEERRTRYEKPDLSEHYPVLDNRSKETMTTSYYTSDVNAVLMQSRDAAGTPSTTPVPDVGTGSGRSGSAVNRQYDEEGNEDHRLSYFENHATHEIGHAVGNKRLVKDGIDSSGDDYAKNYGGWAKNGSAISYARQLGWTDVMDGTDYNLTHGTTNATVRGSAIRDWLISRVSANAVTNTNALVASFSGNEMAAIKSDGTLANHTMVLTVEGAGSEGSAFKFLRGIPSAVGGKVHYYCTRWDNAWVSFNKSAWDERVSHYSVSSYKEMFAEIYTSHYTGGATPAGMQPYFNALDTAEPEHFPEVGGGGDAAGADGGDAGVPNERPWP